MAKKKAAGNQGKTEGGGEDAAAPADLVPRGRSAKAETGRPYVVLARKYRPARFEDLIGQEAMVTTLRNAFATDRIAQGYMLTGVRGVGKTTTARILSRALNYEAEGFDKPTFDMPAFGRHCAEIMEGRHPDVLEMDAASNTGVDNMREIIESARYRPLMARYKVYLIDEVHMLSKGAFNALLKTLEEPPGHVKFIFATTEVRKVPVTVLSRCQRFDLRRVDVPLLSEHLRRIVANEGAEAEADGLALIARAAEGSVRDGLSLLDQALAMGAGKVEVARVRAMLGLADRGRIFDMLEKLLGGAAGEALDALAQLHRDGAEPGQVLADLADAVHVTTRAKTLGAAAAGEVLSAEEKRRAGALAERLSVAILARAWQILLKGLEEVAEAPNPMAAAEMVLVRLAYTADLPAPDEIIKALGGAGGNARPANRPAPAEKRPVASSPSPVDALDDEAQDEAELDDEAGPPAAAPSTPPVVRSFADVVALAGERREAKLKVHLEEHVSLVRFDADQIELHLLPGAPKELGNELREKLNAWTGKRWMVALSSTPGERPLGEVERERANAELRDIEKHPAVAAVLQQFPEAKISGVRPLPGIKTDDTGTG
ncbi:MAG TPA: DNA polymerase III subunit gamma/tau [Hyphomicrobiaceae bacterium]|nr:DNA polymerase III subunit gamma/tau [Hyphomicrobiaceae bacterium]